ncbi:MAG: hypothetical protein CR976_02995 [Thiotrichales bacterium]|nr:MAG: hypothetical protein CR976_02995 [Thiotrichales bacterium]
MANPSPANAFAWQGGEEIEVFSFVNTGECLGPVALLDNNNDPFVTPVNNGGRNSMGTNPGNSFSNLGWDAGNNYGGNYGGSADCRTTAANNDPVAVNDSVSVEQGSAVNIDVLSNDSDADLDILTLTSVGRASKGTASIRALCTECWLHRYRFIYLYAVRWSGWKCDSDGFCHYHLRSAH